jgi:Tol biopolymer transport system component
VQLNNSKVFDDDPSQYTLAVSPDGQRLAIRADQGDYDFDLLSRPINASQPAIALNENPHTGGFGDGVGNIWFAAGNRVVFSTRGGDESGLFSRVIDGSLPAVQLDPPGKTVRSFIVSGDGSKVVLTADGGFGRALYSASINGGAPTMLTGDDDNPHAFEGLWLDPHGRHAVYTTDSHLSTVPTDGSSGPKSLSPDANGYGELPSISPDGERVAFMSKVDDSSPRELFVSPIDASAAPMKLNAVLPDGGKCQLSPIHARWRAHRLSGESDWRQHE